MFQSIESHPLTLWCESQMIYTFFCLWQICNPGKWNLERKRGRFKYTTQSWKEWAKMEHPGKEWRIQGPKASIELRLSQTCAYCKIFKSLAITSLSPLNYIYFALMSYSNEIKGFFCIEIEIIFFLRQKKTRFTLPRGFIKEFWLQDFPLWVRFNWRQAYFKLGAWLQVQAQLFSLLQHSECCGPAGKKMLIGCRFILGIGLRKGTVWFHIWKPQGRVIRWGLIHLIPVLAFGNQSLRVPVIGFAWVTCLFVGVSRLGRLRL